MIGSTLALQGQDSRSVKSLKDEADQYYADEQYNLAIQDYRELADQNIKDAGVGYRLAECYRKTFNYSEAEVYYLKVFFLSPVEYPLSLYYYALMLKLNGSFEESIDYFDKFIDTHRNSPDLKEFVEQAYIDRAGCETARDELNASTTGYPAIPVKINTTYNDFAPAVRDSTSLVISSGRIYSNRQSIDERFGEAFTDNYYYKKEAGSWVDKTKQIFGITNTKYNDGSGSFNRSGDKYYYTVCGMNGPHCRIYVTEFIDNKWTQPIELNSNINYKNYESRQPAVSMGGDSLVFATNRPGGSGGFDLWLSINAGGENWGPAMNLGQMINTKLNELSPTFTTFPNVLFFASDGHEGVGGLDLYMSKRLSTGETILYNLGSPFNSNRDDCFMSIDDHEVYWSSNRQESLGGFDIMAAKIPSITAFISRISLKKRNARRDINLKLKTEEAQGRNLQASRLEEKIGYDALTYEKKQIVDQMVADQFSNIALRIEDYKLAPDEYARLKRIAEERYLESRNKERGYLASVTVPTSATDQLVTGVLKDSLSGKPLPSYKILLVNRTGEVLKITRTNEEGKFRFTGVGSGEGYLRIEKIIDEQTLPAVSNLSVTTPVENEFAQLENIYFDFDHYGIRPEARRVLDELAGYLKDNTGAQLEIFAFADDRGTSEYNLKLTQKRGQSVVDYLTKKGVDQTGLALSAKGKVAPKEVDLDLQRQYNRRVEFYLYGSGGFREIAKTYILRKRTDWKTLSSLTGISEADLKAMNGSADDEPLKAFQPVRLPVSAKIVPEGFFF